MQDDEKDKRFGAAQPLMDPIENAYTKVKNWLTPSSSPLPGQKPASTGADPGMVEDANKTFRDNAAKAATTPATPGKRMMTKRKGPTK